MGLIRGVCASVFIIGALTAPDVPDLRLRHWSNTPPNSTVNSTHNVSVVSGNSSTDMRSKYGQRLAELAPKFQLLADEDPCEGQNCNGHGICQADPNEINGYICLCEWHWSGRDCRVEGPGTFWPLFIAGISTIGSILIVALLATAR
eukprot:Blabericola_migrator_1__603@NODE_1147_length_5278_cov_121_056227_g781_i0_p4_GENE_NODE_1147_length_5278_cov_121_056227_g781_i0NODE_1147_length_5278_cov_121_056227_g781_i0_p4_ORF_typecomplete_len147_score8_11DUF3844/PF12955_7/0_0005EGF_2/PF07974_13/4_9e03EGF_2/PF07974_13/0_0056Laminin_EGF/PF00053_24/0_011Fungal_trans_2/PF11951_8/0_023EGF_Tenascin/PF18720_1/3_4e03EGF_Tenascin/PF18720_1/0_032EGF/PF00008_27/0_06EGF_alliinase/PF04863_13/0_32EGF_CA/PF07645_15/2_6_NODE_1147_length_5278_cov_121_056227_g7